MTTTSDAKFVLDNDEDTDSNPRAKAPKKKKGERINAVGTSSWTAEELEVLDRIEKESTEKCRLHASTSNKYANKHKWLRYFSNVLLVCLGTAGVVKSFSDMATHGFSYEHFAIGTLTLFTGLISSASDAFNYQFRSIQYDTASDRYGEIGNEVRVARATPNLDRRYCDLIVAGIMNRYSQTNTNAPYIKPSV